MGLDMGSSTETWSDRTGRAIAGAAATILLLAMPALADAPPPPGDARLVFGSACPGAPAGAMRVVETATPKGPQITLTRTGADPGPFETLDVSFAHVSRRLFFKAKTAAGLIEFQGHARKAVLEGLLSDDHGDTRTISLPAGDPSRPEDCKTARAGPID
jgi:hypothetical protein